MSIDLTPIETQGAPTPKGPYSQGVVVNGLLFSAGFGPHDPDSGDVVGTTIEEQTHRVMKNLNAVLEGAGIFFAHVVKVSAHLHNLDRDFAGFNAVYERFFAEPYPVRIAVGSTLPGILVEIEVIAQLPD